MSDLPSMAYGDAEGFKELLKQPSELFIIWDRNTGKIAGIVECQPFLVTMAGSWSSQYEARSWKSMWAQAAISEENGK